MSSIFQAILLLTCIVSPIFAVEKFSDGEKLFALKLKPLFTQKCLACHGDEPEKIKSKFDMRSRESMIRGGEIFENEVLIPSQGNQSFLYIIQ